MHNGYCAKWKCETTSSTTAGSCSGNYTSGGRCYKQGNNWDEAGVEASAQCHTQTQERCENIVELTYYQGNDQTPPSLWGYGRVEHAPGFPIIKAPSLADAGSLTSNSYQMECMGLYNPDPKVNACKVARYTSTTSIYVPGDSSGVFSTYIVTPRGCKRENGGSQSCAGPTTESDCKAKSSSCTRTPGSSSSSLKCYRQGMTAAVADSECATLTKPSCINSPAPKVINGQCKHYPGKHYPQPAGSTANGCLAGDYIDTADTNTYWKWECRGKNGGSIDSCNAEKKVPINGKCSTSKDSCVSGQFTITVVRDDPDPYGSYQGRCILEELSCNGLYGGTDEYCGESFTGPTSC